MTLEGIKEKLAGIGQSAKNIVLFIVFPITAVVLYIMGLQRKARDAQAEAAREKLDKEIKETIHAKEQAGKEADKLESDFIRLRDEYRESRKSGLPDDSGEV